MTMNRIINDPDLVVEDAIEGYVVAHPEFFEKTDNSRVLKYSGSEKKGKVGIITGGGSGHVVSVKKDCKHQRCAS